MNTIREPWKMHSVSYRCLIQLKLVLFQFDDNLKWSIATFQNRRIIVDDTFPRNELWEAAARELIEAGV